MAEAIGAFNDSVLERDWAQDNLKKTEAKGESLVSVCAGISCARD